MNPWFEQTRSDIDLLLDRLPKVASRVGQSTTSLTDRQGWQQLTRHVYPHFKHSYPFVVAAIIGGLNTGKSTLFNYLTRGEYSAASFEGCLTRRVLLAGHSQCLGDLATREALFQRFAEVPQPWQKPQEMTQPGPPLYAVVDQLPPGLLLLDTPDFNGVLRENPQITQAILLTADVVLLLLTNVNYRSREDLQFLGKALRSAGRREVIFIYRVTDAMPAAIALKHMEEAAAYLGTGRPRAVFRMIEDSAIAHGLQPVKLERLDPQAPGESAELIDYLARLSTPDIKRASLEGGLRAAVTDLEPFLDWATDRQEHVRTGHQDVARHLDQAARAVASIIPDRRLKEMVFEEWQAGSTGVSRIVRWLGRTVWPFGRLRRYLQQQQLSPELASAFDTQVRTALEEHAQQVHARMRETLPAAAASQLSEWGVVRYNLGKQLATVPAIPGSVLRSTRQHMQTLRMSSAWKHGLFDPLSDLLQYLAGVAAPTHKVASSETGLPSNDRDRLFRLVTDAPIDPSIKDGLVVTVLEPVYQQWLSQRQQDIHHLLTLYLIGDSFASLNHAAAAEQEFVQCRQALDRIRKAWLADESPTIAEDMGQTEARR